MVMREDGVSTRRLIGGLCLQKEAWSKLEAGLTRLPSKLKAASVSRKDGSLPSKLEAALTRLPSNQPL